MAAPAWDCVVTYASFGDGTANSSSFVMPRAVGSVTLHIPALDGATTTVKVQALDPQDGTTFHDVFTYDPGDGSMTALAALPESQCTVIPASAMGAGVFRLVASASQTTAAKVSILFDRVK